MSNLEWYELVSFQQNNFIFIKRAYNVLVRPMLEFCNHALSPTTGRDVTIIECPAHGHHAGSDAYGASVRSAASHPRALLHEETPTVR